ncbi:sno [Cordylochernes scorpioides]|uniref:Sno n=1 Tax=Cordylochernes scorpioides TaxID=51811 RepID=A0ABY6KYW4_9ARAC|nr:sno [Cordylochernes scorpioides]
MIALLSVLDRVLAQGFHRRVKSKNSIQDDDVLIDDTTTKPLFTPQEKGRKATRDRTASSTDVTGVFFSTRHQLSAWKSGVIKCLGFWAKSDVPSHQPGGQVGRSRRLLLLRDTPSLKILSSTDPVDGPQQWSHSRDMKELCLSGKVGHDNHAMEAQDILSAALDESGIKSEEFNNGPEYTSPSNSRMEEGGATVRMEGSQIYSQIPWQFLQRAGIKYPYMSLPGRGYPTTSINPFFAANGVMSHQLAGQYFNPEMATKYWMNNGTITHHQMVKTAAVGGPLDTTDEADEEEEEMGHADTYGDYKPSKLKIGNPHPDPVVETSSLYSVQPPDVWYKLSIPEEVIDRGSLSALQLEAIVYACQQHETILPNGTRAGFLIGDGAGVGKGRTLAGIIFENYLLGRKRAIWLSVSNDLKYDSERDLKDIGAGKIEVYALNKFKYAKISSKVNNSVKKGVIFSTYSSLIGESQSGGKYRSRLKQLLHWCGEDFDGVIVFDECHKAKNLCPTGSTKPTKTGLTVLELQNKLPKARIVYASATGASEPKNMAYMTRLGLWGEGTTFREFSDFISAVEKRGVGAMELVAMDMKLRGIYMARQLSFAGVAFKIEEIPLGKEFITMYDESVKVWVDARAKFQSAAELMDGDSRSKKTMWGQFWASHQRFFKYLCIASKVKFAVNFAREAVKNGKCVVIGLQSTGEARTLEQLEEGGGELSDFVSTAKSVFQSLVEKHFPAPDRKKTLSILGLDIPDNSQASAGGSSGNSRKPLRRARQGVKRYKEYILSEDDDDSEAEIPKGSDESDFAPSDQEERESEENTSGESSPSEAESDFNPFGNDSDSDDPWASRKAKSKKKKGIKRKRHHMSSKPAKNPFDKTPSKPPPLDSVQKAISMKDDLLIKIERLGDKLPPNTLDHLIDDLGGPENVAEMTGRKGRVVSTDNGTVQYESRSEADVPLELLNLTEKQRFMDGEKHIAIISEAASSGISLQSDRRAKNQARRVHITLELPWSADRAVQQFGRTHRSNQVSAPEYLFLISDLAGERRFASIVAKRLESLGALTHGDRRAGESRDLSRFNIDNKYGRAALESVMRSVMELETPLVPPPRDYERDFFADIRRALVGVGLVSEDERTKMQSAEKDFVNMSKFLNRILGMEVDLQNRLFQYFTDTLEVVIQQAKKTGRYDLGILDLGHGGGDTVKRIKCVTFVSRHATGQAKIELHTVSVERGQSWSECMEIWSQAQGKDEGFYISSQPRNNKRTAILAVTDNTRRAKDKSQYYRVYRPNTGLQAKQETLNELRSKYKKVEHEEARHHWEEQYDASTNTCSHMYWYGMCRKSTTTGSTCEVGLRRRTYYVLSGSVLSVWSKLEAIIGSMSGLHSAKLQVIRFRTQDGFRVIGTLIPGNCVAAVTHSLKEDATKTFEEDFKDSC